jgi:hypothetical protein
MNEWMVEKFGPKNVAGIFHEDGGEGFFFLYDTKAESVLRQVQIYDHSTTPEMTSTQVEVIWSSDNRKAGLTLWGRMRALLPLGETDKDICYVTERPEDAAIDAALLTGFPQYLDRREMLDARKRYWTDRLLQSKPDAVISTVPLALTETAFMKTAFDSHHERAAVFEDDGETGYLYLFTAKAETIAKHLHIYDRSSQLQVSADDVDVLWSTDESKCAVVIWGQVRGIIDLRLNKEGRVLLQNSSTPGVSDRNWLKGFELM